MNNHRMIMLPHPRHLADLTAVVTAAACRPSVSTALATRQPSGFADLTVLVTLAACKPFVPTAPFARQSSVSADLAVHLP